MKKLVLILIGIFCISVQLLYAEGEENLRYKSVTTYEKHDGRKNFWGQDRYADVSTTFDAYISTDLRWEIHRYHVTCKNPGYAKCRKTLEASIPEITTSGQILPIEIIENIEDDNADKDITTINVAVNDNVNIEIKYEGYIKLQLEQIENFKKLEGLYPIEYVLNKVTTKQEDYVKV